MGQTGNKKTVDNFMIDVDKGGLLKLLTEDYAEMLNKIIEKLDEKCTNCTLNLHVISCGSDSLEATRKITQSGTGKPKDFKESDETLVDKISGSLKKILCDNSFSKVNVFGIDGAHVYNAKNLVNGVNNFLIGGTTIWKGIDNYHSPDGSDPITGSVPKSLINQINFRPDNTKPIQFNLGEITKEHKIKNK